MSKIQIKKYQDFQINIIPAFSDNYIFLLQCFKSKKTIAVDPGDFKALDKFLEECSLGLDFILITHKHFDHVLGIQALKNKYRCQVLIFIEDRFVIDGAEIFIQAKQKLSDKSNLEFSDLNQVIPADFKLGEIAFSSFTTFGHCANHISYFIKSENILFCGDTLFSSGCGRVFADGSLEELFESLNKIKNLPKNTEIFCTHEYTLKNSEFALTLEPENKDLLTKKEISLNLRGEDKPTIPTTLENELKTNLFLRTNSKELRNSLGVDENKSDLEVFKILRNLKDKF